MILQIEKRELQYIMSIIRVFKSKCKTKSPVLYISFTDSCTQLIYTSEGYFLKYRCQYISQFKGEYCIALDFVKNIINIFNDGIIEINFRDKLVVANQNDITFKGQVMGEARYILHQVKESELEEIPIQLTLSNRLLNLNLEELGIDAKDPYTNLYNISKDKLIKMSSFCALLQNLNKESEGEVTLTQDILSICSVVGEDVEYYKHYNAFYIRNGDIEIRAPLSNVRFPNLDIIINKVKTGGENFLLKAKDMLAICEKCHALDLEKKVNRIDVVFKNGLMMFSYNGVLTGSVESGLTLDWKMSFNPLLMRGILKYINEDIVTVCKSSSGNVILIYNEDKSITFMLSLCR